MIMVVGMCDTVLIQESKEIQSDYLCVDFYNRDSFVFYNEDSEAEEVNRGESPDLRGYTGRDVGFVKVMDLIDETLAFDFKNLSKEDRNDTINLNLSIINLSDDFVYKEFIAKIEEIKANYDKYKSKYGNQMYLVPAYYNDVDTPDITWYNV